MTALLTALDLASSAAVDDQQHLGHDFPHPTCCVCRFPIPRWDLAGTEYEHRHASTCTPATPNTARPTDAGCGS